MTSLEREGGAVEGQGGTRGRVSPFFLYYGYGELSLIYLRLIKRPGSVPHYLALPPPFLLFLLYLLHVLLLFLFFLLFLLHVFLFLFSAQTHGAWATGLVRRPERPFMRGQEAPGFLETLSVIHAF